MKKKIQMQKKTLYKIFLKIITLNSCFTKKTVSKFKIFRTSGKTSHLFTLSGCQKLNFNKGLEFRDKDYASFSRSAF